MVTVLSETDVRGVLNIEELLPVVERALVRQAAGEIERPDRPHFPVGVGLGDDDSLGTGLVMPAYIHGRPYVATKLASLNEDNEAHGLPTLHAQIVLTNAQTGIPEAFVAATTITNARTGCIGGLAVRELAGSVSTLGVLGAGAQARWQTRAISAVAELDDVRIYSPSSSRDRCAGDLKDEDIPARAVDSPRRAVEGAGVVVTATTSETPVFPAEALGPGTLVVAVGAYTAETQELEAPVLEQADRVFADVPGEVIAIGDLLATELTESELVPMGAMLEEGYTPSSAEERIVVESVGSATLDAATSEAIYEATADVGTEIDMR